MIISGLWIVFTYTRLSSSKSLQGEIIMSQRRACLLSLRPSQPASNWFVCSVSSGEDWGGLSVWLPRQQTSAGQECGGISLSETILSLYYSQRETVCGRASKNINIPENSNSNSFFSISDLPNSCLNRLAMSQTSSFSRSDLSWWAVSSTKG